MTNKCNICNNEIDNTLYFPREMMFGFRDVFEYFECAKCGCLQISEIPGNLEKYYPENYYSYSLNENIRKSIFNSVRSIFKKKKFVYYFKRRNASGNIINKLFRVPDIIKILNYVKPNENSKILDVGSGVGHTLLNLRECGFLDLTGIDPYIKNDIYYKNGVRILKKNIYELNSQYDIIIMDHSFEHMPRPLFIFQSLSSRLTTNGLIIIRIPTVSSFAWKYYKTNWVQLDAPRHLFLHSINSIEILAKMAELRVELVEYDSNSFQLWGSEQYKMDIPLCNEKSFLMSRRKSLFTRSNIGEYEKKSVELNANNNGDQFTVYLRKY